MYINFSVKESDKLFKCINKLDKCQIGLYKRFIL
jgi:hypothetical protein